MRFLNKTYLRFFLTAASLLLTLSNDLIAQGCVSTSPYSWLWPSHKNWFIAPPNLWNGQVINMATGAQTSVGTGGAPAIQQYEGTSCASDDNGNLLFFTNGRRLFKGTGASVTNPYSGLLEGNEGGATGTNGSAAQGVITVRHPLNPTKYYIFTTDDANGGTTLGFNYYVFNSSGTNVAPTGANRLGSFRACEGIAATKHANGVDIWITCLESGTGKLNSYLLTCAGLTTTPVVSAVGPVVSGQQERGGIAFSVDGTHFATGFSTVVTAYKFDNSTGVMSDKHTITGASPSDAPYDIIFSPDGSKIYYTQQNGNLMYINISGWPSAAAMITSRTSAGIATLINSIEFAADGFLYMSTNRNGGPIAKISGNYNAATGLSAANVSGTVAAAGLPSMYLPPQEEPDIQEVGPYCVGDPAVDLVTTWLCAGSSAEDATNYPTEYAGTGITNAGAGIFNPTAAGAGTHQIIFTRCSVDDTIWITVNTCSCPDTTLSNITAQCSSGGAISLNSYKVTTEAGTWSIQSAPIGSTASISGGNTFNISNTVAGSYVVRFTLTTPQSGCPDYAERTIVIYTKPNISLTNTTICSGDAAATFDAGSGYTTYAWSGNGTGSSRTTTGTTAGTYTVRVADANGCKDTSSATLAVNTKPNVVLTNATICSGDVAATFDAGSGYTAYAWSANGTGSSRTTTGTTGGTYTVRVADANGCKETASATLTVNAKPNVTLTNVAICSGDPAATFDAGTGYTTYAWSGPATGSSQTISATIAGIYQVIVTAGSGCKDTATATLTVNTKPNVVLTSATICSGDAAATFDAGSGFTTYAWSGNGTGSSRTTTGTTAGTYTVRVVDANGCKDTSSATLTVNAKPNLTLTNANICSGDAAATFDAGAGYTSYAWFVNGTGTAQTTSGITAGTYTVNVIDANGCKDTASAALTVNTLPIVNLGNDVEVCFDSQAAIFDAGNAGSSYLWSNSSTAKTITTATSNTYSVEVTNTNGCKGRDTVELIINALPTVDLGADRSICSGSNTTFDAGAGFTFYLWQNNTTNQTLNTGAAGDYSVTVIDDKGCSDSDTAKVILSTNLTVALGADLSICVGEPAVTFNAGNTGATFLWSDGSNAQTLTTATAGTYTVAVTDGSGCAGKDTVKLTVNQLPIVALSNAEICQGSAGAVFAPGAFASYKWSTGETSASITKNVAGTYKVTVTDGKGCKDSASADLTVNPLPIVSLGSDRSICPETSTTFDAGTFASYLWNDNSTLQTKTATSGGNVIVEVIDSKGCKAKDTAIVSVKNSLTINLGLDKAICAGDAAVTFDAALAGMNYLWSNAETSQTITTAAAGTYIVNVDDGSGCAGKDTVKLIVNNLPVVNLGADKSICSGDPMVTFDAGAGYASYGWSNNSAVRNITVGAAGVYSVEVIDNNGCIAKDTVELIVNNLPIVDLGADRSICTGMTTTFDAGSFATYAWNNSTTYQTNAVSNQGNVIVNVTDGKGCKDADTAYVTVSNNLTVLLGNDKEICFGDAAITFDAGIAGATYSWNSGESTQTVSTDVDGSYAVTVTTPDGCAGTDVVTLRVNPLPTVTIANQTICAGDTATFNAGNFAAYSWLSGENTSSISKTTAGTYTVQVTDAKGCKNASSANLIINALPALTVSNKDVCTGSSASFDAGAGFSSYVWSSGETTQSISKSLAGTYTVRVKDANNCKVSASATLVINAPPTVILPAFAPRCLNDQPFKMNGGMPTGGQYKTIYNSLVMAIDTFQVKMMGAGSHQVMYEYTDNNGCKNIASSNVVVNNMPTLSIADKTVCAGESATFDAGPGFSLYYWNTAANTRTMATSTGGKYMVNVTNAQGCKASDTVELIVNANPQVDLGADKKACEGSNFTLTSNVTASSYLWNNNATSNSIVVNTSGKYSLTVTDVNGCKGSDDIQLSIIARPLVDLGADKQICAGSSVLLNTNLDASASVYWSTGAKDKAIIVNRTGAYMVQAYYDPTCPSFDVINVIVVPMPISTLGNDTVVCFNEIGALTLEAGAADEFLWKDKAQSTASSIDVQQEGIYIVQLTNANLCSVKDTISINQICVTSVYVPNAFSPNGDATNDVFYVKGLNVEKFHLVIFNRWGELIFESYDINNGWDGTYMGNEVQISAYVWKVDWLSTSSHEQKTKNERTGTVSLIR